MSVQNYDPRVTVDHTEKPCGGCGNPTKIRINGKPGHLRCFPAPAGVPSGDVAPAAKAEPEFKIPKLLHALQTTHVPRRRVDGYMRSPWWRPDMPGCVELIRPLSGWNWSRKYTGEVVVLDRTAAWISAASSADVAHGKLEHTGETDHSKRPGLYLVNVYPWLEDGLPSPLGPTLPSEETVWVTQPRLQLLHDLALDGRWPDASIIDSYTGDPVRLKDWVELVKQLRTEALRRFGRESAEYDAVKREFSTSLNTMGGDRAIGQPRKWKTGAQRIDWLHTIQEQTAVTLWRWADSCAQVIPELPPVQLRHIDELVLPADALDVVTTVKAPGRAAPLRIDQEGIQLGTFKVKSRETW